jgi:hypothetical protein
MTKAEEFRSQTERTGKERHASLRKPKKAAWGRDKQHAQGKATHALEVVTRGPPSRKSTRASANRVKGDAPMTLSAEARNGAPRAVARKAQVKRGRVRGKPLSTR